MHNLIPKKLYDFVVWAALVAAALGRPWAIAVLVIVTIEKVVEAALDEMRRGRSSKDADRLTNLETEVKQLNLMLSFKNIHK